MKMSQRIAGLLSVLLTLSLSFPSSAAEADAIPEETAALSEAAEESEEPGDGIHVPILDEPPAFHARLDYWGDYTVVGTFTDFTPDVIQIDTLYSLDEATWQTVKNGDWNLYNLNTDDESKLQGLWNQPCLFAAYEPLKSYLAEEIDCFYLKLRITREDGFSYETQSAKIERGELQPFPEGTERSAYFLPSMAVTEPDPDSPHRYLGYGRYELTVPADATAEEISALLPDTLPAAVYFKDAEDRIAIGTVDCPVTWKPLSIPPLSPGDSVTIPDAAEALFVPAGTRVSTPLGVFELSEPLSIDNPPTTDEIRLVLNVSPEGNAPDGVLREARDGLEVALRHKPTGAVSIQAYVLTEGESEWTELSGLSLSEQFNQPSTANSGYVQVLQSDQEPYRSYLAAARAGATPVPFFIGLKIKGGIYDGKELILPWPDTYEQLPHLPGLSGMGGNEGNAGAGNKGDSTESGQRPSLPPAPDDQTEKPLETTANDQPTVRPEEQTPGRDADDNPPQQTPNTDAGSEQNPEPSFTPSSGQDSRHKEEQTPSASVPVELPDASLLENSGPDPSQDHRKTPAGTGQRPYLSQGVSGSLTEDPEGNQVLAPLVVQAAEEKKTAENSLSLPGGQPVRAPASEHERRFPLFPATAILAGGCIGEAIRRKTGYCPFRQIAMRIRHLLHR